MKETLDLDGRSGPKISQPTVTLVFPSAPRVPRPAVKASDLPAMSVPRETLFKWHSAAKLVAMYPGMRERIGSLNMDEVDRMVLDLETVLGVVKGNPDFEGF